MSCYHSPLSVSSYGHDADRNNISTLETDKLVGQISYTCNDGFWEVTSESCTRMACNSSTGGSSVSWTRASTCNVSSPTGLKWGDQTTMNQPYGYSGDIDATVRCVSNGNFQVMNSNAQCYKDCDGTKGSGLGFNWSESVSGCSTTYNSYMTHNTSRVQVRDTSGTARGQAYIKCDNGSATIDSTGNRLCRKLVNSGRTVSWNNNCVGTLPENLINIGQAFGGAYCTTVTNTTNGYTGTATACATSTGGVTVSNATCSRNVCKAGRMSWGNTCSGYIGDVYDGNSATVTHKGNSDDFSINYRGSATYTCDNGRFRRTSATCEKACSGGTVTWDGGNCSDTVSTSFSSTSVTNDKSGYTGSGTATCNTSSGQWSVSGTCKKDTPDCGRGYLTTPNGCLPLCRPGWSYTGGGCCKYFSGSGMRCEELNI